MEILLDRVADIAVQAGHVIMEVYRQDFAVESKEDKSPLTEADRRANEVILRELQISYPDIPWISEETKAKPYAERASWKSFWLIDPLDGTKEFIKKNGEFTVNIALIEDGIPVLGVVYQPATGTLYTARKGVGAFKSTPGGSTVSLQGGPHYLERKVVLVVASRSHMSPETEEFINALSAAGHEVELTSAGSSLKLCLVAEGAADVYPRFGPTMEWDTAAAHAVALEAGRKVNQHPSGEPLNYNKENLLNPWFLVE
jgi:3'(2'), 5'-bisphosphate nucleotidase